MDSRRMAMRVIAAMLGVFVLATLLGGCATTPRFKGVAQESATHYTLGMIVDANRQVVEVAPGGAAEKARVAVGDTLISLTWVLSEAPEAVLGSAAGTTPLTTTTAPIRPAPGVENKTIAFTDVAGIRNVTSYGVPLRLEIVRAGEARVLTIIPQPRGDGAVVPTAAPRHEVY